MPSMNARGHTVPHWEAITPATGLEVGGTTGHKAVGVGQYTEAISGDVADVVMLDMQLESWLESGVIGYGSAALAEYRLERREAGR